MKLPKPFSGINLPDNTTSLAAAVWPCGTGRSNLFYKLDRYRNSKVQTIYLLDAELSGVALDRTFEYSKSWRRMNVVVLPEGAYSHDLPDVAGRTFDEVIDTDDLSAFFPEAVRRARKDRPSFENPGVSFVIDYKDRLLKIRPAKLDNVWNTYWNYYRYSPYDRKTDNVRAVCTILGRGELSGLPIVNFEDARDAGMSFVYETPDGIRDKLYGTTRKLADIAQRGGQPFVAAYNLHELFDKARSDTTEKFCQGFGGEEAAVEWFFETAKKYFGNVSLIRVCDTIINPFAHHFVTPFAICGSLLGEKRPPTKKMPVIVMTDAK